MELEEGMYVRTKDGEIHTIKSISNEYIEYENGFGVPYELREYIIKASNNIIDLIKVDDYVNGEKVEHTYLDGYRHYIKLANRDKTKVFENRIYEEDIKTIVTKEQFESMSYKIGD